MAFDTPTALTSGQTVFESDYNKIRDSIIANAHDRFELGGSRTAAIRTGGGYQDAENYIEFYIPNGAYNGYTWTLEVEVKTENAATTVTPKLRNVTDGTDAVVGSAGTSTSWGTYQSLSVTIATGKRYRLQASKSDDLFQGWVFGRLVRTHA